MSKIWQKPKRKGGCIPEFQSSEELWNAACEYFEWATENPLIEQKPMSIAGELVMAEIEKMRDALIKINTASKILAVDYDEDDEFAVGLDPVVIHETTNQALASLEEFLNGGEK